MADIKPELPDNIRTGVYATYFSVSVNQQYAVLDFGSSLPEPGGNTTPERNIIVSRIITTKDAAKTLADLLNKVIQKSENLAVKKE